MDESTKNGIGITLVVVFVLLIVIAIPMAVVPKYRVWSKELKGGFHV